MSKQPWFISREINQQENGSYTDIVARESKESAKNAQQEMMNIPNAAQRYACYEKDSNICINCEQVAMYTA